jgi:hypothetical protein
LSDHHAECGEEQFTIELHEDESDIFAYSKPNPLLTKLAYPVTRMLQRRFAFESMLAMLRFSTQRLTDCLPNLARHKSRSIVPRVLGGNSDC